MGCSRPKLGYGLKTWMHQGSTLNWPMFREKGCLPNRACLLMRVTGWQSVISLPQFASKDRFINSTLVFSGSVLIRFNFFKKVCFL